MNQNIMFVDDNIGILESLKWVLKDESYKLFAFTDPEEAIRSAETTDYAVVIADQQMPEMYGTLLLAEIKARSPNTIRMVMSAFIETKMALEAFNNGLVFRFIRKPWDEKELREEVAVAVAQFERLKQKGRPN